MPTLDELARAHTDLDEDDLAWLHLLMADWQIIADLSFADLVLWLPDNEDKGFWAGGQMRPTTGPTALLDDVIGLNFAVIAWGTDPTFGLSPEARAFWERLGAKFITAKPAVQIAHNADAREGVICVGDIGNRLKDWFARWPLSVVMVRPDRFVGALCSPQRVSETTQEFARALSAPIQVTDTVEA